MKTIWLKCLNFNLNGLEQIMAWKTSFFSIHCNLGILQTNIIFSTEYSFHSWPWKKINNSYQPLDAIDTQTKSAKVKIKIKWILGLACEDGKLCSLAYWKKNNADGHPKYNNFYHVILHKLGICVISRKVWTNCFDWTSSSHSDHSW